MKQWRFLLAALFIMPSPARSDALSLHIGGYHWWQRYNGTIRLENIPLSFRDDLNLKNAGNNVYFVAFEHPIPLLPNLRVQYTDLSVDGDKQLERSVVIDNTRYSASATLSSEVNLSHTDATLYWRLLDSFAHLHLGLTGRIFNHRWAGLDGVALAVASDKGGREIASRDFGKNARVDLNGILPMVYVSALFDLPLTGVSLGMDVNGVVWHGSHLFDGRARIAYEHHSGLGAELGWRRFDLDYDDADNSSDLVIDGAYLSLSYHF